MQEYSQTRRSGDLRGRQAAGWLTSTLPLCIAACSSSPSQDVLGSFFPSWMLCAAIGGVAAVAARLLLHAAGMASCVVAPPIGYLAFAAAVTLIVWLSCFGQ